jgi:hypothetical protein
LSLSHVDVDEIGSSCPSAYASVPTISDDLIPLLAAGRISPSTYYLLPPLLFSPPTLVLSLSLINLLPSLPSCDPPVSVPSISSIQLSGFILFNTFSTSLPSSTPLELPPSSVDAIIYATGYSSSVDGLPLSPEIFEHLYLPSSSTEGHRQEKTPNGLPYLYEYALPPSLPTLAILVNAYGAVRSRSPLHLRENRSTEPFRLTDTLCLYLSLRPPRPYCTSPTQIGAPLGQDIHSMWLAGLWSGQIPMPSTEEMKRAADADLEWYQSLRTMWGSLSLLNYLFHSTPSALGG